MLELFFILANPVVLIGLILIIVLLLILIGICLKGKHVVTVPSLTLVLNKTQYDRGEEVDVTGTALTDVGPPPVPGAGDTITLDLTDAAGIVTSGIATAIVAADGTLSTKFNVPTNAAVGAATLKGTDGTTEATYTATLTLFEIDTACGKGQKNLSKNGYSTFQRFSL